MLELVPIEYFYGLSAIELRAREGPVGSPFAFYRPADQVIVLYSLPKTWSARSLSVSLRRSLERFHATIVEDGSGIHVSWRSPEVAGLWFYSTVLAHELGHHRRFQFRRRNGARGRRIDEETIAELHARRLTDALFKRFRSPAAAKRTVENNAPST